MSDLEIRRFGPDDADEMAAVLELRNAVHGRGLALGAPAAAAGVGRDAAPRLGRRAGDAVPRDRRRRPVVGYGTSRPASATTSTWPGSAWRCTRRTGAGARHRAARAAGRGGPGRAAAPRSASTAGTPTATRGFAARHGLEQKSHGDQPAPAPRRGRPRPARASCTTRRRPRAGDYELVRVAGRTPPRADRRRGGAERGHQRRARPTTSTSRTRCSRAERVAAYEDAAAAHGAAALPAGGPAPGDR